MQKKVTFSGRDHTAVLDQHIEKQLERIEHLLKGEPSPIFIDVVVDFHDVHQHHHVTTRVKTPHFECYAEHEGPDIFAEINEVMDRVHDQLRTEKKKLVDTHRRGCGKGCRSAFFKEMEDEESGDEE
ncbi:MAG: hypothetical protein UW09_C0001G0035 [candidate division TM6 bacterium GW2011_GWF2_43_87]|nr:MAG: hypothetical protein UW09_C0001G0035 [candidate division TM6 bacterium GW2011_GWF2_43_87]